MKQNFNLDEPSHQLALAIYESKMITALKAPQRVENAVLPIYWTLKTPTKPEQIGSGVVVKIESEYFVFSASHIFDSIGTYQLLIGSGHGTMLSSLVGDRFSSTKGASGTHSDDPIDASVFHIKSKIPEELIRVALNIEDLDFSQPDKEGCVHMFAGFRSKKSRTIGNQADAERECFPTIEYKEKEYCKLGLDFSRHIALAYEDKVLINGNWQITPKPKGMSGGAIIKVDGVSFSRPITTSLKLKQLLSGITIAQRREKSGKPGVLIGTRVNMHLTLIATYLPGLLDAIETES